MYAIIKTGGRQYWVREGERLRMEKLNGAIGETIDFDQVLLVKDAKNNVKIGQPYVQGATVRATIEAEGRGKKIIVLKKKPRNRYRRKQGHRQTYTDLTIEKIQLKKPKASKGKATKDGS